jgi:hypothetical protein
MVTKLIRLAHKIAIQLHLVAESCTICSSRFRRPVRKLLDTPSYVRGVNIRLVFCDSLSHYKAFKLFSVPLHSEMLTSCIRVPVDHYSTMLYHLILLCRVKRRVRVIVNKEG